jgi:ComF family protein
MLSKLIDALLPGLCLLCDQPLHSASARRAGHAQLCDHCHHTLPWNAHCCTGCGVPLPRGAIGPTGGLGPTGPAVSGCAYSGRARCEACCQQPPPFTRTVAPLLFESVVQTWLHSLKFHHGTFEGRVLGELLASAISGAYAERRLPDVIVPVPLSRRRLAWRGHNQALSLAGPVAHRLRLTIHRTSARRTRHTNPQSASTRAQRRHNAANSFISKPWRGGTLAIVDDVMTTGATATQMAEALLEAGAGEVHLWVAARTPPPC